MIEKKDTVRFTFHLGIPWRSRKIQNNQLSFATHLPNYLIQLQRGVHTPYVTLVAVTKSFVKEQVSTLKLEKIIMQLTV